MFLTSEELDLREKSEGQPVSGLWAQCAKWHKVNMKGRED